MNAEIGVQWRNYGSGNQSPSIVLPPLPDLIPIRKNGTPIKNVFNLEDKILNNSCSNSTSNSQYHAEHHEQIDVDLNILSSTISMLEREEDLEWPPSQKPLPPINSLSSTHEENSIQFSNKKYFNFNIKKERDDDTSSTFVAFLASTKFSFSRALNKPRHWASETR